jgi:hypothetical protein
LRFLVNDPKATSKQRLEACKMLFALEVNPNPTSSETPKPHYPNDIGSFLARIENTVSPGTVVSDELLKAIEA